MGLGVYSEVVKYRLGLTFDIRKDYKIMYTEIRPDDLNHKSLSRSVEFSKTLGASLIC